MLTKGKMLDAYLIIIIIIIIANVFTSLAILERGVHFADWISDYYLYII
jgi:hypothetical protein